MDRFFGERSKNARLSRDDQERRLWTGFRVSGQPELRNSEAERLKRRLELLPTSAAAFYRNDSDTSKRLPWTVIEAILAGTRSANATETPLALLRDYEDTVVRDVVELVPNHYLDHVRLTIPAPLVGNGYRRLMRFTHGRGQGNFHRRDFVRGSDVDDNDNADDNLVSNAQRDGFVAFASCGQVEFPEPNDRNVNMLPFILGEPKSLPSDLLCYYDLIQACPYVKEEEGKVAYLTVQESYVDTNSTQRRGGLHVESPGFFTDDPNASAFTPGVEHPWGMGVFFGPDHYEGGIYFASNRDDTSEVWDALVDTSVPGIVEKGGGCDYLRKWIGQGTKLKAGELCWMTDRTPHEALPQKASGHRQFFRLVMPYIRHWYAEHSTPNPAVPLPAHVHVIDGNKFDRYGISSETPLKSTGEDGSGDTEQPPLKTTMFTKTDEVLTSPELRDEILKEEKEVMEKSTRVPIKKTEPKNKKEKKGRKCRPAAGAGSTPPTSATNGGTTTGRPHATTETTPSSAAIAPVGAAAAGLGGALAALALLLVVSRWSSIPEM